MFIISVLVYVSISKEYETFDPSKYEKISFYHRYLLIPKAIIITALCLVFFIGTIIVIASFFTE